MPGSRKIGIAFVLPSFAGGGAERVMLHLASNLDPGRFDVSLLALDGQGPLKETIRSELRVIDLQQPRFRHARHDLIRQIAAVSPDIVLSTMVHLNLGILMARGKIDPKTRIIARESNTPSQSLKTTKWPWLFRLLMRRFYPRADRILCPSQRTAAELQTDFGIEPTKLTVLPHPVDVEAIRRLASPQIRAPGSGARLIAAGRMTHQKGFDRLLDVLLQLPTDTHVTFLGEGSGLTDLKRQSELLGLNDRVCFRGFVDNPWSYVAGADAFLLPSRWEGMPNAALEALAVGTPVIATPESGGALELAEKCPPGAMTIAAFPQAFSDAMRKVSGANRVVLRDTLLPDEYNLTNVMTAFETLLQDVDADASQCG